MFSITTAFLPQFGKKKLGFRSNFNLMVYSAAGSLGSYLSAIARSATGTYKWAFLWNASAWLVVVGTALANFILYDRKRSTPASDSLTP